MSGRGSSVVFSRALFKGLGLAALFVFVSSYAGAQTPAAPPAAKPMPYGAPVSLEAAKGIVAAAEAEARKNGWEMMVWILDSGGNTVMAEKMDNTQLGSIAIAEAKARTALNFRRPSKAFQDLLAQGGVNVRYLAMPGEIPIQGGVLLVKDNMIIGAIGASGGTSEQDEQVAIAGAKALK